MAVKLILIKNLDNNLPHIETAYDKLSIDNSETFRCKTQLVTTRELRKLDNRFAGAIGDLIV